MVRYGNTKLSRDVRKLFQAVIQWHGNNAGRKSTPHFASIKQEDNPHRFLPPLLAYTPPSSDPPNPPLEGGLFKIIFLITYASKSLTTTILIPEFTLN